MQRIRNEAGIVAEVRRVDKLPNGLYRIDYASGLVETRKQNPVRARWPR